jgi:hypothetical protein
MFERLTRWENNDKDVADLLEGKSDFDGLTEAINRLAEYEDSELSPEEVQELAKAKADGRLEILPAKPGDIDAVPVVLGKWKLYGNDDDSGMSYWCTVCNFQLSEDLFYSGYKNGRWIENGVFKYCPNCGAKMEVEP